MPTNSPALVLAVAVGTAALLAGCGASSGSNVADVASAAPTVTVTATETVTPTSSAEPTERPTATSSAGPSASASAKPIATTSPKVCGTQVPKRTPVATVLAGPVPDRVTFCIYPEGAEEGQVAAAKASPTRTMKLFRTSTEGPRGDVCTAEAPLPAAFVLEYADGKKRAVQVFNGGCRRIMEPVADDRQLTEAGAAYLVALTDAIFPE